MSKGGGAMTKLNKKTISMTAQVVFLLLLAGLLRLVIVNSENYLINVVFTLLVFTIYISMLSVWSMSIWRRVMHIHIRGYLLGVAGLMPVSYTHLDVYKRQEKE